MLLALLLLAVLLFIVLPLAGMAAWALVSVIIVGLIIGGLGRLVVPGRQAIGWARTLLAGLSGSIVGGFVGQHVLDLGRLVTILLEIAIAALVVFAFARSRRRLTPGTRF